MVKLAKEKRSQQVAGKVPPCLPGTDYLQRERVLRPSRLHSHERTNQLVDDGQPMGSMLYEYIRESDGSCVGDAGERGKTKSSLATTLESIMKSTQDQGCSIPLLTVCMHTAGGWEGRRVGCCVVPTSRDCPNASLRRTITFKGRMRKPWWQSSRPSDLDTTTTAAVS